MRSQKLDLKDAPEALLAVENVTVHRQGREVLHGLDWTLRRGEHWAVVGATGAGKSTFAAALAGELQFSGEIRCGFARKGKSASARASLVSFTLQRAFVSQPDGNYQARWYAGMEEPTLSARRILEYAAGRSQAAAERVDRAVRVMRLSRLLERRALHLSNGEMRRVLIARALVRNPELLLLDEPFIGLDAVGRAKLGALIQRLMRSGLHVLLFTARPWELPDGITHELRLEHGRIAGAGPRRPISATSRRTVGEKSVPGKETVAGQTVVELRGVSLRAGRNWILRGIEWDVRAGERWALVGHNGAGKTALLSLLTGDNPQAYAQHVRLFGSLRDERPLWDWKSRIGLASPDEALHHDLNPSARALVASGFFDTLSLYRGCSPAQERLVARWLKVFGLSAVAERPFRFLSDGQQRLALVARALVKRPRLLILDEPCQGLDASSRRRVLDAVEQTCRNGRTTLIIVSHYADELPRCITHCLELRKGRIVRRGRVGARR